MQKNKADRSKGRVHSEYREAAPQPTSAFFLKTLHFSHNLKLDHLEMSGNTFQRSDRVDNLSILRGGGGVPITTLMYSLDSKHVMQVTWEKGLKSTKCTSPF
jgi:hypothetical protein